jgi:hypothetical protein
MASDIDQFNILASTSGVRGQSTSEGAELGIRAIVAEGRWVVKRKGRSWSRRVLEYGHITRDITRNRSEIDKSFLHTLNSASLPPRCISMAYNVHFN